MTAPQERAEELHDAFGDILDVLHGWSRSMPEKEKLRAVHTLALKGWSKGAPRCVVSEAPASHRSRLGQVAAVARVLWVNRKAEIAMVTAAVAIIREIVQAASGH